MTDTPRRTYDDLLPSMPVLVRDFASSTSAAVMSNEQFGAYWRLLLCAWLSDPPCSLPDDDAQLARIAQMSPVDGSPSARW